VQYFKVFKIFSISLMFIVLTHAVFNPNFSSKVNRHSFGDTLGNVAKFTEQAAALNSLGRYDDAMHYLDKALSLDPTNVVALVSKGISLDGLDRLNDGMLYYDKALAIDPTNKNAINNKIAVLISLGKVDEAVKYYDKTLSTDPNNARIIGMTKWDK
jgi:tetratricopeptide (TPR) repeat protein